MYGFINVFAVGHVFINGLKLVQQGKCALCVKQLLVRRKLFLSMAVAAVSKKIPGKNSINICESSLLNQNVFLHLSFMLRNKAPPRPAGQRSEPEANTVCSKTNSINSSSYWLTKFVC